MTDRWKICNGNTTAMRVRDMYSLLGNLSNGFVDALTTQKRLASRWKVGKSIGISEWVRSWGANKNSCGFEEQLQQRDRPS